MSMDAALPWPADEPAPLPGRRLSPFERIRAARQILRDEAEAITHLAETLDGEFARAVELVAECAGMVIVTGMGKAGNVGRKISATLRSTGTRSAFLHPAEAIHGDLGLLGDDDVLLALSQSGETDEITRLLECARTQALPIIAITARADSSLGRASEVVLELGRLREAGPLGLAPSTSTTAMLALGDALALVACQMRGFGREDFAKLHPGGSLGRMLSDVDRHMRRWHECRVAQDSLTAREVFVEVSRPGRRSGAIMLLDAEGALSGIFTDSDLARLFEAKREGDLDRPICELMTARPKTVLCGSPMHAAVALMAERKISELPVIDQNGRPVGLLDITDIMGLFPEAAGKE
jgi:arabinose-5-phosphate isomerase